MNAPLAIIAHEFCDFEPPVPFAVAGQAGFCCPLPSDWLQQAAF